MKKSKGLKLYLFILLIVIITIYFNGCQSKYERANAKLRQISTGSSLVEKGYPGFWFKINKANKLEIYHLEKGSDADRKGLRDGDIVYMIDGIVITNKYQFFEIINNKRPNEKINLTTTRKGLLFENQITLRPFLLPTTLYALMEPIYKNQTIILAPIITEFNVAGVNDQNKFNDFKKIVIPQLLTIVEGAFLDIFENEKNFRVVDRNNIEYVVNELRLQQSGLTSRESQLKVGSLLGATHLLFVNYSFFAISQSEVSYMCAQKLTEVESGKILATTVTNEKMRNPKLVRFIGGSSVDANKESSIQYSNNQYPPILKQFNSRKKNLSIEYDSRRWLISKTKNNDDAEIEFMHKDGEIYSFLINEKFVKNLSRQAVNDQIIENIKRKGMIDNCKLLSQEKINVDGKTIDALYIEGIYQSQPISLIFHVYSGNAGTIQFYTFLPKDLFREYEPDIRSLHGGLRIHEQ